MTEDARDHETVRRFLRDIITGWLSPDSRAWRTFRVLLTRPGQLTVAYSEEARDAFVHPLQIFLLANLVFFIVGGITNNQMLTTSLQSQLCCQPHSGLAKHLFYRDVNEMKRAAWLDATRDSTTEVSRAEDGTEASQPAARRAADYVRYRVIVATLVSRFETGFNDASNNDARTLVILMVPLLALVIAILEFRRGTGVKHIVFSLHLYAFALILYSVTWGIGWIVTWITHWSPDDQTWGLILFGGQTIYLVRSIGVAYGEKGVMRIGKGVIAGYASIMLIEAYRFALFLFVFYTVRH